MMTVTSPAAPAAQDAATLAGSVAAYDSKREVVERVRRQRARTVALLESLAEERWDEPVLPGWRVRETIAHLVATDEASLTGRLMRLGLRQVPIEQVEAWNEDQVARWAGRPVPSLLMGLERWGARMARAASVAPAPLLKAPVPSPFGKVSTLWLLMLRVYDEWIHGEDIRRALGLPPDDDAAAIAAAGRHLLAGIPFQTVSRVPDASGRVVLRLDGLPAVGFDLAARRYGAGLLAGADATIHAEPAAAVMVASRRDNWRDQEAAGRIRIEGDRGPAETFLEALLLV